MGLIIDCPDLTSSTNQADAYLIFDPHGLKNKTKGGMLECFVWRSKVDRDAGKKNINTVAIPAGDVEIIDTTDNSIQQVKYSDLTWVTGSDFYTKIKTFKVNFQGTIVDLSLAEDELS